MSESRELGKERELKRERELWQSHPGLQPPSTTLLSNSLDSLASRRKPLGESAYGLGYCASVYVETACHAPVGTPLLQMQVEDLAYWRPSLCSKHERLTVANIHRRPCTPLFAASSGTMMLFKKCALTT